jgi:hypothetical protein
VQVANGAGLNISHIGHSLISGSTSKPIYLRNVLHVPHISKNLLSVHKLTYDNRAFAEIYPDIFYLKDQATRKVLLRARSRGGLYPVSGYSSSSNRRALSGVKIPSDLWHRRLGHPSSSVIESVISKNKLACTPSSKPSSICDACQRAKVHQLPLNLHLLNLFTLTCGDQPLPLLEVLNIT